MADEKEGPRSAVVFLDGLADGACAAQLSGALHDLGKVLVDESLNRDATVKGELTLKIKFACERNGVVSVDYDIKVKTPPKVTSRGLMWLTPSGNFTAHNPRQMSLPLREVARKVVGIKDIDKPATAGGEE
jgi:hypothetical protein